MPPKFRSRQKNRNDEFLNLAIDTSLLSVNGQLRSMYYEPGEDEERSQGYTPVEIGKPLVVRYLYFFLKLDDAGTRDQEIMVSTYVKTIDEKKPAAEAINFYDPKTRFVDDKTEIQNFGADTYGHELIYYTKSFIGEPIKLTTKIMELDNSADEIKQLTEGIDQIGGLPFFAEYLPYAAIAKSSMGFLEKIFNLLNKDDPIIPRLRLDMFYSRLNSPKLQSGRIVCIQGKSEEDMLNPDKGYKLDKKNRLVDKDDNLYKETPYFVLQVNSESQTTYEDFEYFQNAAELLTLTNREGGLKDFVETTVDGFRSYSDIFTISNMEDLQDDLDDEDTKARFKAMFKGLSSDVKSLYRQKYKDILNEFE